MQDVNGIHLYDSIIKGVTIRGLSIKPAEQNYIYSYQWEKKSSKTQDQVQNQIF